MRQAFPEVVEEGSERDRGTDKSNTVRLASRFVRDLREIKLAPICLPVAVFVVTDAWSVNCRNGDAGPQDRCRSPLPNTGLADPPYRSSGQSHRSPSGSSVAP